MRPKEAYLSTKWPDNDPDLPSPSKHSFGGGCDGGSTSPYRESKHEHKYVFKYVKEKMTENGRIVKEEHYFCETCLEEKILVDMNAD